MVPTITSLLNFNNLLEQLTKFGKGLDLLVILKATVQEWPNGREAQGKVWGACVGLPCPLGRPPSQHRGVLANLEAP